MAEKKEIIDRTLDALVYQALDALSGRDEEARRMEAELTAATERLVQDTPLDIKTRDIVNKYAATLTAMSGRHYRHLYLQGAKDCVALLRELGVIK